MTIAIEAGLIIEPCLCGRCVPGGPNPSGRCWCGCGDITPLAVSTKTGCEIGQHVCFLRGHWNKLTAQPLVFEGGPNPSGLCWCGCGQITPRTNYKMNDYLRGQHLCYLRGHQRTIDLTGRVFGSLTVIERAPYAPGERAKWICECSFGSPNCLQYVEVTGNNLLTGNSTKCVLCGIWIAQEQRRLPHRCGNCGRTNGEFRQWEEMILCKRCYQLARERGTGPTYLICSRCKLRRQRQHSDLCWECGEEIGRCQGPRFYYSIEKLWADLDRNFGQWGILDCVSQDEDCLIWLGSVYPNGSPMFHGRSLRAAIYRRYVDPDYSRHVYRCARRTGCINPDHFNLRPIVTPLMTIKYQRQRSY